MKHALFAIALIASPVAAQAQSPQLENACLAVAKHFLLNNNVKTGVIQSFPELTPPGARLTYSTRADTAPADMSDTIECEFEKPAAPFGLVRFCLSSTCYAKDEKNPENRRRFEEVRTLMDRTK